MSETKTTHEHSTLDKHEGGAVHHQPEHDTHRTEEHTKEPADRARHEALKAQDEEGIDAIGLGGGAGRPHELNEVNAM